VSDARHVERVARIEKEVAGAVPAGARVLDAGCGGGGAVELVVGDIAALPFEAASFDAALSVGVLGFLDQPGRALEELARVVVPGGHLIVTLQMPRKLSALLNPVEHSRRSRRWSVHTRAEAVALVGGAGFRVDRIVPTGFGTPTLLGVRLVTASADQRLRARLEALAEADRPVARLLCGAWIVLATRSRVGEP
jgi:SAM-dependent methyltransferase